MTSIRVNQTTLDALQAVQGPLERALAALPADNDPHEEARLVVGEVAQDIRGGLVLLREFQEMIAEGAIV